MIYILLSVVGVFFLLATFGIVAARFALQQEKLEGGRAPKALPSDPYALVWWQDLQDLGLEFHLANSEIWRGRISWHRYPDGADESHAVPMKHWNKLDGYRRRIEWKEPEILAKHAHCLVDWSALERAYQLKLLNGSVWQFNTKSEGIGENNEMAWRRISSPEGIVFESMNSIHKSLNQHLVQIRRQLATAEAMASSPQPPHLLVGRHASNLCGQCHFRAVSIPGGICRACREAMGAGA